MDMVFQLVTYFALASVATERAVGMLRQLIPSSRLDTSRIPSVVWQILAAAVGGLIAWQSPPVIPGISLSPEALIALTALAVSGGSGLWNEVLKIVTATRVTKTL